MDHLVQSMFGRFRGFFPLAPVALAASRIAETKRLQEETETFFEDLIEYRESNELLRSAIDDVEEETKALEEEYERLKKRIEEGQEMARSIMACLEDGEDTE